MPSGHATRLKRAYRIFRIFLSLTPLMLVHLALLAIPYVEFTIGSVVAIVLVTRLSGLGITAGFHRYFSHRSYKVPRWFQFLLACAGCTALQKGPLWWAVHHRIHHKHSDVEGDPHSPVTGGFWHGHVGWLFTQDLMHPDEKVVHDLAKYPELIWLDRLWMIPGLLLAALCYAVLDWNGLIYGFCLSTVLVFQVTFAVNSLGHLFGPQRFNTGEGSRNNLVLGYLAMGDGWHNNHHRAPYSARHGFAWYELDMTFAFIRLLQWVGLAWDIKLVSPDLQHGIDKFTPSPYPTGQETPLKQTCDRLSRIPPHEITEQPQRTYRSRVVACPWCRRAVAGVL